MKKIYSLCLIAMMALASSLTVNAEVSATVTWDVPGSLIFYVGSTAEASRVIPDAEATSYTAIIPDQTYGTLYVRAADGYMLENAICLDDNKTIAPNSYGTPQININMSASQHGGHTIKVNCARLEYDGNIDINFISAGEVTATFGGSSRSFRLSGGLNTIPFSTKFEKTIAFSAITNGSSGPYIKKGNETIEWKDKWGSLSHSEITLADGDKFEVKWNDEAPSAPIEDVYHNVNISYGNSDAESAVTLIYNITQRKTIQERDAFKVREGDRIRILFNTRDYDVTLNGTKLASDDSSNSTKWESEAITGDMNISVAVSEREYAPVYLSVAVSDPDCVLLHDGTIDGPAIDLSQYEPTASSDLTYTIKNGTYSESITTTFHNYSVPVNGKYGKIFIDAKDNGHYVKYAFYKDGSNWVETSTVTGEEGQVYVDARKKNANKKLVVSLASSESYSGENILLTDRWGNKYPIVNGYNELTIDPEYANPFKIRANVNVDDDLLKSIFIAYANYSKLDIDKESNTYTNVSITGYDDVIHIFLDKTAPAKRTVNIYPSGGASAEITIDRITRNAKNADLTYSVFHGTEIIVKPSDSATPLYVGGERISSFDNGTYTFKATKNTDIHIGTPAVAKMKITPGADDTVESFEYFLVEFPDATTVEQILSDDDMQFSMANNSWANWGFQIEETAAARGKAFKVTPNFKYPSNGIYTFLISEGFFRIDGIFDNDLTRFNFNIHKEVSADDIEISYNPTTETIVNEGNGLNVAVTVDESLVFALNSEDIADFEIKLDGQMLEYYSDWDFEIYGPYFMINVKPEACSGFEGVLSIGIKAGALTVSGIGCPSISHSWNVVMPKDYTMTIGNPDEETVAGSVIFTVSLPDAANAEIYNEFGATLIDTDYFATPATSRADGGRYTQTGTIKAVEGAAIPTFTITFSPAPVSDGHKYTLRIQEGTFTLDGYSASAEHNSTYVYKTGEGLVLGIIDAIMNGNENSDVYDINGRIILRKADRDAINSLRRGIYIINGKKIMK